MGKIRKILKYVVFFVCVVLVVDAMLVWGVGDFQPKIKQPADVGIILGAAINSPALYNRSLKGLEIYSQGKVKKLILSGGRISDKDISEAGYMEKVILQNADISSDLILDEQSSNTWENIHNARALTKEAQSAVIISDKFHLARAVLLAKRAGFKTVYWTSPSAAGYLKGELYFYYLREMVAMIAYTPKFVFGK